MKPFFGSCCQIWYNPNGIEETIIQNDIRGGIMCGYQEGKTND